MEELRVAIDGPAGAGKSTVAKQVAKRLGVPYVDTGAMYRAVTWKALDSGIDLTDEARLVDMVSRLHIALEPCAERQEVIVDGVNVTDRIRSREVTDNVSKVSAIPGVRAQLVKLQQKMARQRGVVMDGRDIGTHVMPDAEVKVFLTASLEERARRRMEEFANNGVAADWDDIKSGIAKRDEMDSTRQLAPLRKADDAHLIDTTGMTVDQVVDAIVSICRKQTGTKRRGEE